MEKLEKYLHPYWWYIALSMFIKFLGAAAELTIPYLMEIILDYKVPAGTSTCTAGSCSCAPPPAWGSM